MSCVSADLTGKKFGRLTAVERTGKKNYKGGLIWKFLCECGNFIENEGYPVTSGSTKSCGCYSKDLISARSTTHGKSGTNKYVVWNQIKARILDPTNEMFPQYGGRGLTISDEFIHDMDFFYSHLGPKPSDDVRYTVGRIDNDVGYILGNIRWETYSEQSRNKRKMSTNSSNVTGVVWSITKSKNTICTYAVARWHDGEKQRVKAFSAKKLGLLPAFKLACEYREKMIAEMNAHGAGYSEKHGK